FAPEAGQRVFESDASCRWMSDAIAVVKQHYPQMACCYSYSGGMPPRLVPSDRLTGTFDLFEPHIWMVHGNDSEFHRRIDYQYERFDPIGYEKIVDRAETLYRSESAH